MSLTYALFLPFATLSVLGACMIMASFVYFKRTRNPSTTYIFCMATSDCGSSLAFFFTNTNAAWCATQGIVMTFFQLSGILWTAVIARFMYKMIVLRSSPQEAFSLWQSCAFVYTISLTAALLPLTTKSYGSSGAWCWIEEESRGLDIVLLQSAGIWWRMFCFYFPLWITVGHNGYVYHQIAERLKNISSASGEGSSLRSDMEGLVRKLKFYPLILAFCYIPATLLRVYHFITGANIYSFVILAGITQNLIGFLDFCVYANFGAFELWKSEFNNLTMRYCYCSLGQDDKGESSNEVSNPVQLGSAGSGRENGGEEDVSGIELGYADCDEDPEDLQSYYSGQNESMIPDM